jgi:hypothetical protein
LTGITDPALLRASHIIPWSDCNDEQRLDVHNDAPPLPSPAAARAVAVAALNSWREGHQ